MTESIMGSHLEYVQKLKDRGEIVLQPKVGKPMGSVEGYIKTQVPHKDAGSIFEDREAAVELFGEFAKVNII